MTALGFVAGKEILAQSVGPILAVMLDQRIEHFASVCRASIAIFGFGRSESVIDATRYRRNFAFDFESAPCVFEFGSFYTKRNGDITRDIFRMPHRNQYRFIRW